MKILFLLMAAFLTQVSASTFAQKITLNEKEASLVSVFEKINKQIGVDFVVNIELLSKAKKVNIQVKDQELNLVLQALFEDQPLHYEMKDKAVIVMDKKSGFLDKIVAHFAAIDVRGRVVDKDKGVGMSGATVKIKGGNKQVATNAEGVFFLQNVEEDAVLEISFVGYKTRELKVAREMGDIALEMSSGALEEVLINKGYYMESQRLSTGNTVTITAKDIEKQPVINPLLALQGRATGVQITQNTGVANGSVSILIRGRASLNTAVSNNPLYMIDGVPYQSQLLVDLLGNSGGGSNPQNPGGNPLNYINPSDIASIDFLKDADATAIYGSRGGNGVILITTKKGKFGAMSLDVNAIQGFMQAPAPLKLLNTQQYLDMRREAFKNDGMPLPNIAITPNDPNYDVNGLWSQTAQTDWQEELIGDFAAYTNLNLSLSGGTAQIQYALRGTFNRQGSLFPGKLDDKRGGLNFNTTVYSKNQKLKIDFSGNFMKDNNLNTQADVTAYTMRPPNAPKSFNPDGSLNYGGVNFDNALNPFAYTKRTYNNKTDNLVMSLQPSYKLAKGLMISANLGFTMLDVNSEVKQPNASYAPPYLAQIITVNNLAISINEQKTWIAEPQLSYETQIKALKLSALIGGSYQKSDNEGKHFVGNNFVSDALIGSIVNAGTIAVADGGSYEYNYNALFGRLNVNFSDKYVINLTARRDGSSKFGPGNQFGNFYSAAAAWIFSSEKLIADNLAFLSLGKLRASYGTSGNDGINNYAYYDLYTRRTNTYQGAIGFAPNSLPNPDVAWEKNAKLEVAVDIGILNNRLTASAAYYRNRSSNQLLNYKIPAHTGFSNIFSYNFPATVENSGWEFILNSNNITKKDLQWTSSFNISLNRNKLIEFQGLENSSYATSLEIGKPVTGRTLAWVYSGIDSKTGLYTFMKRDGTSGSDATGLNPNNQIYRTVWVNTLPKYFGGLNNSISYRSLRLDVFLQFVKQKGRESLIQFAPGSFNNNVLNTSAMSSNVPVELLDRWQKEGDQAKYQRYTQTGAGLMAQIAWGASTGSVVDASFVRAKNVTLSYQLSEKFKEKLNLKGASINLTGQNLFTLTSYKGRDPETQSFLTLPPLKVFVIGLQITL